MLLFKTEHREPILYGLKTQTRRQGKKRWKVGSIHQAKTGFRRDDRFADLKILAVRQERLDKITEADANAEGYDTIEDYKEVYRRIYGQWDGYALVWVIDFEMVWPDPKPYRDIIESMREASQADPDILNQFTGRHLMAVKKATKPAGKVDPETGEVLGVQPDPETGSEDNPKLPEVAEHEKKEADKQAAKDRAQAIKDWKNGLVTKTNQIDRLRELAEMASELSTETVSLRSEIKKFGAPAYAIIESAGLEKRCDKALDHQAGLIGALIQSAKLVEEKLIWALDNYPDGVTATELTKMRKKYHPGETGTGTGTKKKAKGGDKKAKSDTEKK